jgi:predicted nucleic acid-binding protein
MRSAIVDTGPLVAFFDRAEQYHRWVIERVEELDTPLLICEPVLAEAMHLLARFSRAQRRNGLGTVAIARRCRLPRWRSCSLSASVPDTG